MIDFDMGAFFATISTYLDQIICLVYLRYPEPKLAHTFSSTLQTSTNPVHTSRERTLVQHTQPEPKNSFSKYGFISPYLYEEKVTTTEQKHGVIPEPVTCVTSDQEVTTQKWRPQNDTIGKYRDTKT